MICAPFVSFGLTGPDQNGRGGERHRGNKKAPGQHKAIRAQKVRYSVKKQRFSHPSLDCTHWTAWIFLTVAKIQSEFVGGQIASWQLPPVSRRICQRQRVISFEGKKNGGLEMSFKTADGESNLKIGARNYLPQSTVFFFPRTGQITYYAERSRCALIGSLYFLLQLSERCITDGVFNPAGVLFRCFLIDASSDKLLREKSVTLIYFLSNLMAYVS